MKKLKRKKYITVVCIPDDSSRVFSLKMRSYIFYSLAILWMIGIGLSIYIISKHINYRATLEYNKYLLIKDKAFAKDVLDMKSTVEQVSQIDKQMRDLLQLKSKNAMIKYTGLGGPSYVDDASMLEKCLKDGKDTISKSAFDLAVKYVNDEAKDKEKSFQEIIKYITDQRAKLTAVPSGWPLKGWITSGFGSRLDPFSGALTFHEGVDIVNDVGTPVKATADGVVSMAGWEKSFGYTVVINHGNGYTTRYGHMLKYICSEGQCIKKGQVIGYLGNTGRSTAPHLHYEVRLNGVAVNPVKYLNKEIALK